jgi:hypothetical protein
MTADFILHNAKIATNGLPSFCKVVAFAPLIRDQGNFKLATGDIESAIVKAMLLAYDTEKRLQKEMLTKPYTLV